MSDGMVEIPLLPDEVRILTAHHCDLGASLAAQGNAAAAARLKARADELDLELSLQTRLGATVARMVKGR